MFGKRRRVGGERDGSGGRLGHGAVMAVLAGHVEKRRDDDIGSFLPVGAHQSFDDPVAPPARQGVRAVLGEAEVVHRIVGPVAEPDDVGIQRPRRLLHLARPHDAERRGPLGADGILPPSPRVEQAITTRMP